MIKLDSIHISRTYGGCLEGCPAPDEIILWARGKVKKFFGDDRPILVLDYETKKGMLPEYEHIAWLSSWTPIEDGDGSHLFVIWYSNVPSADIEPILSQIDWKTQAKDWWI